MSGQREYGVRVAAEGSTTWFERRDPAMIDARQASKDHASPILVEKVHREVVAVFEGGKRLR